MSAYLSESYFLAPLAAIAVYDNLIRDLFISKTYNNAGIIAANVYIKGIPTLVTVDDYLPYFTSTKTLAFS